jgi:hypothetical protein
MATTLLCIQSFAAWGKEYAPGDPVDATNWPDDGTLARRLENGFVKYQNVPDAPAKPDKKP